MTIESSDAPNHSARIAKTWSFAKPILAAVFGMLGLVLLVAGKSTAGSAFICSALLVFLPLNRLIKNRRLAAGMRTIVIAVLCLVAIRSVANTDIVPGRASTGYVFVDQVLAILERFQDNLFGKP